MAWGGVGTFGGLGMMGGGVVLDITGAGAIVGVPVTAEGIAVAGHGFIMAGHSLDSLTKDLPKLSKASMESGSKGTGKAEYKKPKSGLGKEKSSDVPSWARGEKPFKGENGKDFAKRLLDEKYGSGNYNVGPKTEYNRLRKWGDRGFE